MQGPESRSETEIPIAVFLEHVNPLLLRVESFHCQVMGVIVACGGGVVADNPRLLMSFLPHTRQ